MNDINLILDNNRNILGVYDKSSLAFVELMDLIIGQLNVILRIINEGIDIEELNKISNNYRIISMKMNSNVIYKEYFFSLKTFSFFNNNKEIVEYFDEYNFSVIKKKFCIKQLYDEILNKNNFDNNKSLNVFIPAEKMDSDMFVNNNIDTEYINNKIIESEGSKMKKEDLLKKIEDLEKKHELEKKKLNEMKKENKKKEKDFLKNTRRLEDIKRSNRIKLDKLNEQKRIFKSDKGVYNKIKDEIKDENDIPELFVEKYKILKKMEDNDELNKEGDFETYMKYNPKSVFKSTKFDGLFNQDEYDSESESESESESDSELDSD